MHVYCELYRALGRGLQYSEMLDARYLDGGKLVIYLRPPHYTARIYLGSSIYVSRSLKTGDRDAAVSEGWKIYHALKAQHSQGIPVRSTSLNTVIDAYIAYREKSHAQGHTSAGMLRQVKRVSKFWREYAGSKPIQGIGDQDLKQFVDWRREYYATRPIPQNGKRHPTDKTIQWEITEGKAILRWAHEQGLRGSQPLPSYTFTPKKCGVRPPFEDADFERLIDGATDRINTAPDKRCGKSRALLALYVSFLSLSGVRVGEANNLKIRDIEEICLDGESFYRLNVRGKTGERDVIVRAHMNDILAKFLKRRLAAGAKPDDLLFRMSNGQKISTLADQFDALLKAAGLTHNSHDEKHTLYSLRHTYAISALKRGVNVFEVARNMGTSVEMIEKHYAKKATARDFVRTLAA